MNNNFLLNKEENTDINIEDYNNYVKTNFNMRIDMGIILLSFSLDISFSSLTVYTTIVYVNVLA